MSDAAKTSRRGKAVGVKTLRSAMAVFARQQALAAQPAQDDQLALIWPPWNALPAGMSPEERRLVLTGELIDRMPTGRDTFDQLRGQFPFLPFDKHIFNQALAKAGQWSNLVQYSKTTFQLHRETVQRQLGFPNFDDVLTGRVAIYRATKELNLTHPRLLPCPAPKLADIGKLSQRYAAYLRAREDAINLLRPLVFLPRLKSTGDLPFKEQAIGLPTPPDNFPHHIYIARLAALGKCTEKRLADFFAESFLKLTRHQMDEFCNEFHRPTKWHTAKYRFLAPWLADNAPVFRAFKATWREILDAAGKRFNSDAPDGYRDCPGCPDNLKVYWKDYENRLWRGQPRRISPPTGRPRAQSVRLDWGALLTPLPFVPTRKG